MKELKTLLFVVIAAAFFIGLFVLSDRFADDIHTEFGSLIASSVREGDSDSEEPVRPQDLQIEQSIIKAAEDAFAAEMTITAAGDIRCQEQQLINAYNEEFDSFDFTEGFQYIREMLKDSGFTAATLKTTMAGRWNGYDNTFNGYTCYMGYSNSPETLADTLADCSFDLLNTATNHALDSGIDGVSATIDVLSGAGLTHIGTAKGENDSKDYILTQDGLRIAFTGWTSDTDDISFGNEYAYAVNSLDENDHKKISALCRHVTQLQEENDFVIVMLNFTSSESSEVESEERNLAKEVAEAGADVILGTGSIAVKPMDIITYVDEDGFQYQSVVFYGLGNLVSSERYSDYEYEDLAVDFGMILRLHIRRSIGGLLLLSSFDVYPTYSDWTDDVVRTIPALKARGTSQYKDLISEDEKSRLESVPEALMENLLSYTGFSYSSEGDHFSVNIE